MSATLSLLVFHTLNLVSGELLFYFCDSVSVVLPSGLTSCYSTGAFEKGSTFLFASNHSVAGGFPGSAAVRSPVQVRCMILDAWGWCTEMTQRDGMRREEGGDSEWGTHVCLWRIHVDVWKN